MAALGLAALLIAAYAFSAVPVSVTIDGETRHFDTRAGTVADLLVEHGVDVAPGDLVLPGPGARLSAGTHVVVQRARPVHVRADGGTVELRSHGRSALAVLGEAGVTLGPDDIVKVNGRRWPVDQAVADLPAPAVRVAAGPGLTVPLPSVRELRRSSARPSGQLPTGPTEPGEREAGDAESLLPGNEASWTVDVLRATPVRVVENGIPYHLDLAGDTVGEALEAAGVTRFPEDALRPPADAPLRGTTLIVIERAVPFVVAVDEATRRVRAVADTVGEALTQVGHGLNPHDYAIPAADTRLEPDMRVQVVRVVEDFLVQEVGIPYATDLQPDPNMPLDDRAVLRAGEAGAKTQRIRITYEDGVEVSREVVEEEVTREPVSQIVAYGTDIVWRTVDTPDGPLRYWRKFNAYTTSYSASRSGTPRSAPWYGRTRLGWVVRRGVIATDPRVIALGTHMYVPGYGPGVAADTGGGVKNYLIDLGFEDDKYESWHGWRDVYLVEPLPPEDEIRWVLP